MNVDRTLHRPRKRFGQHFLTDPGVIDAIVAAIAPGRDDTIIEIGPGPGAITGPLAQRCGELHVVELDRDLARRLRDRFAGDPRVHVHEADALRFDFTTFAPGVRVVGNLPYNISTPLLFHLLDARASIRDMLFMLQKEVVDRMAAAPGSRKYGRLSVMLQCRLQVDALFDVEPGAFEPPPEVRSAVVRLHPLPADARHIADEGLFGRVVASAFGQRRKTMRNALKRFVEPADIADAGIDPALRPEAVGVDDWIALANHLSTKTDFPLRTG